MDLSISSTIQQLVDNSHQPSACKNLDSQYTYGNALFVVDKAGWCHTEDILGLSDSDIPCQLSKCADLFRQQDLEVIETGKTLQILDIHPCARDEWKAFICTKNPIRDAQNNIVGTLFQDTEITSHDMLELGKLLTAITVHDTQATQLASATSYAIRHPRELNLLPHESELLFFVLRSLRPRRIAQAMRQSVHNIEQLLENLKRKFQVTSKSELIDKAIQQGYLNYIPPTLFKQQLSVILREKD